MYLLIKYIKNVLWRVAKRLSYIEDARCLEVKLLSDYTSQRWLNDKTDVPKLYSPHNKFSVHFVFVCPNRANFRLNRFPQVCLPEVESSVSDVCCAAALK